MSSRVARNPISVPKDVQVHVNGEMVSVAGKRGEISIVLHKAVTMHHENNEITFAAANDTIEAKALSGTLRALVNNMVKGVTEGFERKLQLVGVGYRCQVQGSVLNLSLGFSHPVKFEIPAGIKIEAPTQTDIVISGIDKALVGQVAADIRAYRPPEPYKGKGVRYADEKVVIKETKK